MATNMATLFSLPGAYPDTFPECVSYILSFEGGEVNDPSDPGGHTKYGISKRAYPYVDIASLTRAQAEEIYYNDYWKGPKIDSLPAHIRFAVFDAAVNLGPVRAVKALQKVAKAKVDGLIGTETIYKAYRVTIDDYIVERERIYRAIVKGRKASAKFLPGWLTRLKHIKRIVTRALTPKARRAA
jgi:lysozyme family protein